MKHGWPAALQVFIGCLALASSSESGAQLSHSSEPLADYFANNGLGNAVAVVQHPAGEHREGITYVSYQGPLEDPYVASYDHSTGVWHGPFKAGISELGKDPDRPTSIDNHGKPTLIIDDAGYIHVFYGGHGGTPEHGENMLGNYHYGRNRHAVSLHPLDISSWQDLDNIPPFGTYNQVVKMDNGDIYLFYRHGAHRSDWVWQKSTDNGLVFTPPRSFLKHKRRQDLDAVDSWYAWVSKGRGDDIIVSFDYHLCWDRDTNQNALGHTTERRNVVYMVMNTRDGSWRNVQGEPLQMPLTREAAEARAWVAGTGDDWTFNGSSHLDSEGYPHIGINIGPHQGLHFGGPKQTSHFRWNGNEWLGGRTGGMPVARGDFEVTGPLDVRFLLSYKEEGGDAVVAWWNSENGGESFTKGEELLRLNDAALATSSIIRNAHPDARVIVAEKPAGLDTRRMYLLGDGGPVKRRLSEARILDW